MKKFTYIALALLIPATMLAYHDYGMKSTDMYHDTMMADSSADMQKTHRNKMMNSQGMTGRSGDRKSVV